MSTDIKIEKDNTSRAERRRVLAAVRKAQKRAPASKQPKADPKGNRATRNILASSKKKVKARIKEAARRKASLL